mmetsp:Transcript_12394/g.37212  ORF Transcript_12394/g.37212 Transcript_12394/m.37212 type:complete len:242 (+) Transcript_12394:179-904(+)
MSASSLAPRSRSGSGSTMQSASSGSAPPSPPSPIENRIVDGVRSVRQLRSLNPSPSPPPSSPPSSSSVSSPASSSSSVALSDSSACRTSSSSWSRFSGVGRRTVMRMGTVAFLSAFTAFSKLVPVMSWSSTPMMLSPASTPASAALDSDPSWLSGSATTSRPGSSLGPSSSVMPTGLDLMLYVNFPAMVAKGTARARRRYVSIEVVSSARRLSGLGAQTRTWTFGPRRRRACASLRMCGRR